MSDTADLSPFLARPSPAAELLLHLPHSGFHGWGAFNAEEAVAILRWRHAGSPPGGLPIEPHHGAAESLARRRRRARTMQRLRAALEPLLRLAGFRPQR